MRNTPGLLKTRSIPLVLPASSIGPDLACCAFFFGVAPLLTLLTIASRLPSPSGLLPFSPKTTHRPPTRSTSSARPAANPLMTQQPGPGLFNTCNTYHPATLALPSPAARLSALGPCRHENVTSTPVTSLALECCSLPPAAPVSTAHPLRPWATLWTTLRNTP